MIEKQIGSIETGKGSQNFEEKYNFWKKNLGTSQSIENDEQNAWVCDDMIFKNKELSPIFPKLKFLTFSKKFLIIKSVLHKTQSICKLGWSDQTHTQ